ncbi:MAG TPA: helix-turn-helix domain-containing protein [Candidatus Limnocylindria bacterium]|nr:helix-turn-helix domain-containing protein [Candidatus Limnocylindria bacterium]
MATGERRRDRGTSRGLSIVLSVGREIRLARRSLGSSQRLVAQAAGISAPSLSRIERGKAPGVGLVLLARLCEVVGLELSARAYPGGRPVRDSRHAKLLTRFRSLLHRALGWGTEVPLPQQGDQRAWDGMVSGNGWRYGTEAELNPIDGQALVRRVNLKRRDGRVDGVLLLLPDTRQTRQFRREFAGLLGEEFPVPGNRALELLSAGADPGGSAVIVL